MNQMNSPFGAVTGRRFFVRFAALPLTVLALAACTPAIEHQVTAPQLDRALAALKPCRSPVLPPIPQDVLIDIRGDNVTANAGGELLLRAYAQAYSASRAAP